MNTPAQIVTNRPKIIARIPVTKNWNNCQSTFSSILPKPLRWTNSIYNYAAWRNIALKQFKETMFYTANPTRTPSVEATALVALFNDLCRCERAEILANSIHLKGDINFQFI
jgi:hypothetical protein